MHDTAKRLALALPDRYAVQRELGRGATSIVFLAEDLKYRRKVAVKVLRPEVAERLGADRFLREIEIASRLNHPHILPLFDSGESEGILFSVMPCIEGESLRGRLTRERQLAIPEALKLAGDVAEALAYAHAEGIVHRDIKPENILIEGDSAIVADFGIARAISVAAGDRLTESGIIIGTPHYMSPEQADPKGHLDGRTDVYSLGCVLYEMLVGEPPYTGPDIHAVLARHLAAPLPSVRVSRDTVPMAVEHAVLRALAKVPADRFRTAEEFAAALRNPDSWTTSPVRVGKGARRRWAIAVTAGAVVLLSAGLLWSRGHKTRLDPGMFAVLPFVQSGESPLTGEQVESLLHEAVRRWQDIRVADPQKVNDRLVRSSHQPLTLTSALEVARGLGAGMLVWGEVATLGDSIRVQLTVTRTDGRQETIAQSNLRVGGDLSDLDSKFERLAVTVLAASSRYWGGDSLTVTLDGPRAVAGSAMGTRSAAAWRVFQAGQSALAGWDLQAAAASFRSAVSLDTEYALAHFWAAQVMSWAGNPASEWRPYAISAASHSSRLVERDRRLNAALVFLADKRYTSACQLYRQQIAQDSADFAAWLGLGECNASNDAVIPDRKSPSGWNFQGSYHTAATAYLRAFQILPSSHLVFSELISVRLQRVLFTGTDRVRQGSDSTGRLVFGGFPEVRAETLSFIPYPMSTLTTSNVPGSINRAIARSSEMFELVTTAWISAFPRSASAWSARSSVLELLGRATTGESALHASEIARSLPQGPQQRLAGSVAHLRLLVKVGRSVEAKLLADSILQTWRGQDPKEALSLVPVALLVGRVTSAVEYLRKGAPAFEFAFPNGQYLTVSNALARNALELSARAVSGAHTEHLDSLERQIIRDITEQFEPHMRDSAGYALLDLPAMFGFPVYGRRQVHRPDGGLLLSAQLLLATGNSAAAHREIVAVIEGPLRSRIPPGQLAMEEVYAESSLLLAVGDSARALALLERSLRALTVYRDDLLSLLQSPSGLILSMVLYARLLADRDLPEARKWARHVATLWSDADDSLKGIVLEMQALSKS